MAAAFFCLVLLAAGALATPVVQLGEDLHYDLPDMKNIDVYKGLILNTQEATVDVKDFVLTLGKSGQANATTSLLDAEIKKYTLKGSISVFTVKGDGAISLKAYPKVNVVYTPKTAGSQCAAANTTQYTVAISKIECHISGLKVDTFIDVGSKVCGYLEKNTDVISNFLETNMNEEVLHKYVDPFVVDMINKECQPSPSTTSAPAQEVFDVDMFMTHVLVAFLENNEL